jgi:hypothetical protein
MSAKSVVVGLVLGAVGAIIVVALISRNSLPGQKYVTNQPAVK